MALLLSLKRTVDLEPGLTTPQVFHVSQNDVGTRLYVALEQGGTAYTIPDGTTAKVQGCNALGEPFEAITATVSASEVYFTITDQNVTQFAGNAKCEVVLTNGTNILGTANFIVAVEASPMGADVPAIYTNPVQAYIEGVVQDYVDDDILPDITADIESKADASDVGDLTELETTDKSSIVGAVNELVSGKVNVAQGSGNAGKALVVNSSGNVEPGDIAIDIDNTLTQQGEAADAKATGDALALKANASTVAPEFDTSTSYTTGQYVLKNGVLYRFTADHSGAWTGTDSVVVTVGGELSDVDEKVDKNGLNQVTPQNLQIVDAEMSPNLYNPETVTNGIWINPSTGAENTGNFQTTDYIPVEEGEKYFGTWSNGPSGVTRYNMNLNFVTCYDSSKSIMTSSGMTSPTNPVTIPDGVAYIRISNTNNSYYSKRQFEKGESPTPYREYGELIKAVIKEEYIPPVSMDQIEAFELVSGQNLLNTNDPDFVNGGFLTTAGAVSDNQSYATSGFIKVNEGDELVGTYKVGTGQGQVNMRTVAAYDSNKNAIASKGVYSVTRFVVPEGVSYVRVCWASGSYGLVVQIQSVQSDESYYPYVPYKDPHYELKESYMHDFPNSPEYVFLPSELYVAVGRTLELYNSQVVLDYEKYHFQWVCGKGTARKRKFSITGETPGNLNLNLMLYDDKKRICWVGRCIIHVVAASNPVKKILPIGDSLTNWKAWLQETMLLSSNNISFVGTRYSGQSLDSEGNIYPSGTIHHEGRSGWGADAYLSNTQYTFDNRYDGVSSVEGSANPFWDGSKFSLSHYLTTQTGVSTPDAVQIFLGTNDVSQGVDVAVENITAMVNSIRSEYANLPIFICNTIYRSNQDGYGSVGSDAYSGGGGASVWQYDQDSIIMDLAKGLRSSLANVTNLYFVPLMSCMDREYDFGQVMTKVNPRSSVEVPMPDESVHPQAVGYYQMADVMYSLYCGVLNS